MPLRYWLLKTEPETYSFDQLVADGITNWNEVRNYQARNFLREIAKGDIALIYHSGGEKAVVGIAKCAKPGYADLDAEDGSEWVQIDLVPVEPLPRPVRLAAIKETPALRDLPLIKQSRLSVMPITKAHYDKIRALGGKKADR